jgi:hypothetical protein
MTVLFDLHALNAAITMLVVSGGECTYACRFWVYKDHYSLISCGKPLSRRK